MRLCVKDLQYFYCVHHWQIFRSVVLSWLKPDLTWKLKLPIPKLLCNDCIVSHQVQLAILKFEHFFGISGQCKGLNSTSGLTRSCLISKAVLQSLILDEYLFTIALGYGETGSHSRNEKTAQICANFYSPITCERDYSPQLVISTFYVSKKGLVT